MTPVSPEMQKSIRLHLLSCMTAFILLVAGLGVWVKTAELTGAVIASGLLVVESSVKKVQHPTGGVVGELRVKEGDHVEAGQIVVRLDDTQTRANLAVLINGINEMKAREARLEAERTGANHLTFPTDLLAQKSDLLVEELMAGEQKHFELRRDARAGEKLQLHERTNQLREQIGGLEDQIASKKNEIGFVVTELEGVHGLWAKQLVPITKLTEIEREAARLEGEKGQLVAATAEAKGKIAEVELQIIQVDQDMRSKVAAELAEVRAKFAELVERKVAAGDQLKRVDIRAPQVGTVHELSVHTVGGVVGPGDLLMLVVPDADSLAAEAKVSPVDIDQLRTGQNVSLRFSAFNQRTTPEILGHVSRIAADVTQDQRSGASYYVIRVAIDPAQLKRLKGLRLVPGMPVEMFMQTPPRSVLSYLMKPLQDQVVRSLRDP